MAKNILLMYISEHSGHHQAAIAIERALREKYAGVNTRKVNTFRYTNPILERFINSAYMNLIKRRPEIWGRIYDNPDVARKTASLRRRLTALNLRKFKRLIAAFAPDVVACTQAFPCCMMAAYKRAFRAPIRLVGVLTDYAPHSYWIDDEVDIYAVPSDEVGHSLLKKGVPAHKIKPTGTPIDPRFAVPHDKEKIKRRLGLNEGERTVLVMGGTQGIGPNAGMVRGLAASRYPFQMIFVAGVNKRLYGAVNRIAEKAGRRILSYAFVDNIHELMDAADLIVTKAGGLTTAEALAKHLPMVIVNPLPGQERHNTEFLLKEGLAVNVRSEGDLPMLVEGLLANGSRLAEMRGRIKGFAKPHAASDIAELLLHK